MLLKTLKTISTHAESTDFLNIYIFKTKYPSLDTVPLKTEVTANFLRDHSSCVSYVTINNPSHVVAAEQSEQN